MYACESSSVFVHVYVKSMSVFMCACVYEYIYLRFFVYVCMCITISEEIERGNVIFCLFDWLHLHYFRRVLKPVVVTFMHFQIR